MSDALEPDPNDPTYVPHMLGWLKGQVEHLQGKARKVDDVDSDLGGIKEQLAAKRAGKETFANVGLAASALFTALAGWSVYNAKEATKTVDTYARAVADAAKATFDPVVEKAVARVEKASSQLPAVPIGSIVAWPGKLPEDPKDPWYDRWHECNGATLDDDEYQELADVLGGTYGGSTGEVKLPDFQGMFLRGAGKHENDVEGRYVGDPVANMQVDQVGEHGHEFTITAAREVEQRILQRINAKDAARFEDESIEGSTNRMTPEGEITMETRPVNYAVHWVIRVK